MQRDHIKPVERVKTQDDILWTLLFKANPSLVLKSRFDIEPNLDADRHILGNITPLYDEGCALQYIVWTKCLASIFTFLSNRISICL